MTAGGERGRLILASAGLALDGGGAALLGRLVAGSLAAFGRRRRLAVEIVTLGEPPEVELGVPVTACGGSRRRMALALALRQAAGRIGGTGPALLFDHLGPARIQGHLPAALRSPYLLFLLGIEAWRPLAGDRRRAARGARRRLAISRHTRGRVEAANPEVGPIDICHLALEERPPAGEVDRRLLAELAADGLGEGFLLAVGRMAADERYKGHDELLAALARLAAEGTAPPLVLAGGGDDRERLAAKARELGLAERVRLTGFVSEATLDELYRRCAAFALPSRDEGFGLVYLEAMRAGKPVLAARGSAAEEIIVAGETGLLVDLERGSDALAAALAELADPRRADDLGAAGRRRWQERFSLTAFRDRLDPYLEELLAAARGDRDDLDDRTLSAPPGENDA